MKVHYPITAFFLFFLAGCAFIPCGWDDDLEIDKKSVGLSGLMGVYSPDAVTMKNFPDFRRAEIVLDSAGHLVFKNIPARILDFKIDNHDDHSTINGKGRLVIDHTTRFTELILELSFKGYEPGLVTSYRLYRKNGKNVIFIIVGDPDECSAVRLIQQ